MKKILICIFIMFCFAGRFFAQNIEIDTSVSAAKTGSIIAFIHDISGVPVPDARLYVYSNNTLEFRSRADYISKKSGSDGKIRIELFPGKYFIFARRRIVEEMTGPLRQGDFNGNFYDNPVEIKQGNILFIDLTIEKIEGSRIFSPLYSTTSTSIEGILKDENGPVKNAYVMVNGSKEVRGRPDYISRPTDEKGKFLVYISSPGKYFIIGRAKMIGPPKLGELYGRYKEEEIEIKADDKIKDIEIFLKPYAVDLSGLKKGLNNK